MKVSKNKVSIAMARKCMNPYDVCSKAKFSYQTYLNIMRTGNCKIGTLGKLAQALGVDVTEIIED